MANCALNYKNDCTLNWDKSKVCWPKHSGCKGNETKVRLVPLNSHEKGSNVIRTLLDRFGFDTGNFFSDAGATWEERSLPYFNNLGKCEKKFTDYVKDGKSLYKQYTILKPFDAYICEIEKAFGAVGGANQYRTEQTAKELLENGFIKESSETYTYPSYKFGKKRGKLSYSLGSEIRYLRSL